MTTAEPTTIEPSAWAPLASKAFRALWIAQLVSNLGTWMQTVGAQWMLVNEPDAAVLVSLVQTATTLPVMLLSLPSGVIADLMDRRRLLIAVQSSMAALAILLTGLTITGLATPSVLLLVLFMLGCGQALTAPAWQAIQPELVPRDQIPAAAALGSMTVNVGRAVGPAIAGALVALSGPALVFGLNAVSFVGIVAALVWWRPKRAESELPTERPLSALSAGARFVRSAPTIRRILLRATLFIVPASALWALLPVVASDRLALSSSGYGLLLGALGVGAVGGAILLPTLRRIATLTQLLCGSAVVFGIATAVLATVANYPVVLSAMVGAGIAWNVSLSTLNAGTQLMLPGWVRARGMSVYMLVFMGGQAIGSVVWGVLAGAQGTATALLTSAALLAFCALSVTWWPLPQRTGALDLSPSAHWPDPQLAFVPESADGPVLVTREYRVDDKDFEGFCAAMARVGRSRQRTGAMEWRLYRDAAEADRYVEVFTVSSWLEHMRQHQTRLTTADQLAEQAAEAFTTKQPTVQHLIAVRDPKGRR
jgi:MFS family permease